MNKARVAEAARGIIQFEKCPNFDLSKFRTLRVIEGSGLIESILCIRILYTMDNHSMS